MYFSPFEFLFLLDWKKNFDFKSRKSEKIFKLGKQNVELMNVHERIFRALSLEEPDRIPTFTQSIEPPFIERYDEEVGIIGEENLIMDMQVALELGYDSKWYHCGKLRVPEKSRPEIPKELLYLREGKVVNQNGQIYQSDPDTGRWYVDGILKTPEILREWTSFINEFTPADSHYYKNIANVWNNCISKGIVPIPTAGGINHVVTSSIGMNRFGYMVRKYPQLVKDLISTWAKLTMEEHKCFFEQGIDIMFVCDDYAQKNRLMISPAVFDEFFEPHYRRIADNAHKYGAKFIVHSDGDLTDSFPALTRAGVDGAEPLEYEAGMRLKPLKEKWGDKICLIGNIPASDLICLGTPEQVVAFVKQAILDAADGGGLILGQGANLLANSKVENAQTMIKAIKKFGKYPIDKSSLN